LASFRPFRGLELGLQNIEKEKLFCLRLCWRVLIMRAGNYPQGSHTLDPRTPLCALLNHSRGTPRVPRERPHNGSASRVQGKRTCLPIGQHFSHSRAQQREAAHLIFSRGLRVVPGTVGGQYRRSGQSITEHREPFQTNCEVGCGGPFSDNTGSLFRQKSTLDVAIEWGTRPAKARVSPDSGAERKKEKGRLW